MKIIIKNSLKFTSIFGDFSIKDYYQEGTLVTIGTKYLSSVRGSSVVTLGIPTVHGDMRVKYFTKEEFRKYLREGIFIIVSN